MFTKSTENSNIVNNNPEAVNLGIAELVLKQWALDTIFSSEVKRAHGPDSGLPALLLRLGAGNRFRRRRKAAFFDHGADLQNLYAGNDGDEATLNLVSGGLRVITGAMAKTNPENYKVRTPVALMGVRGTEFSIQLCGDEVCAEDEVTD